MLGVLFRYSVIIVYIHAAMWNLWFASAAKVRVNIMVMVTAGLQINSVLYEYQPPTVPLFSPLFPVFTVSISTEVYLSIYIFYNYTVYVYTIYIVIDFNAGMYN